MMNGISTSPLPGTPGPGGDGDPPRVDRTRRGVHVLLTIYLLPAVLAVLALGGLLVLLEGLARLIEAHAPLGRGTFVRVTASGGEWMPCDLSGGQDEPRTDRGVSPVASSRDD
jgi:hypothetical protein